MLRGRYRKGSQDSFPLEQSYSLLTELPCRLGIKPSKFFQRFKKGNLIHFYWEKIAQNLMNPQVLSNDNISYFKLTKTDYIL